MENIHLNLIKVWFDMIYNLLKPEEYREIKPYWCSKFLLVDGQHKKLKWWKGYFEFHKDVNVIDKIQDYLIQEII